MPPLKSPLSFHLRSTIFSIMHDHFKISSVSRSSVLEMCIMSCLRCVLYGYLKLPSVCGSSKLKTIYEFKVAVLGFCSLIITLHVFSTIPRTTKVLFKFRRLEWNDMTRLQEVILRTYGNNMSNPVCGCSVSY